jgi:hypothetical protein
MNQEKKSYLDIEVLIDNIKYRDWDIVLRMDGDRPYVQIQFDAPDSFTGVVERQYCRKWMLSYYMTDSEIVRTVYKALEAAVLHEFQEDFRFMEEPIFRPHYDVFALARLSMSNAVDRRK